MPRPVSLEVCIDSPGGLSAAIAGAADRIELCAALALGGLSPCPSLIKAAAQTDIPCHMMIRPHAGDFVLRSGDLDAMLADIDAAKHAGLAGVVFGVCQSNGRLDRDPLKTLCQAAGSMQKTLHRAFDLTPDAAEALETAIELRFDRVLTSGQAKTAPAGTKTLAQLVSQSSLRIEVMAGGGVTQKDLRNLVATGVDAIHSSCSRSDPDHTLCDLVGITTPRITDAHIVKAFKDEITDGARAT